MAAALLAPYVALAQEPFAEPVWTKEQPPHKDLGVREPLRVGDKFEVAIFMDRLNGKIQRREIKHAEASYIKVHFRELNLEEGEMLTISNADGTEVHTYPDLTRPGDLPGDSPQDTRPEKNQREGFWGLSVDGDTAILELTLNDLDRGAATPVVIDSYAHGYPWLGDLDDYGDRGGSAKAICGSKDHRRVKCHESSHPIEYARARAVGVLVLDGTKWCTAWRIGPSNHMMTNEHCINSQADVDDTEIWFNYKKNNCVGVFNSSKTKVSGQDFLITDATLDFTLFTVDKLWSINQYGFLLADPRPVIQDEEIYIPGHPDGDPKRLSIDSDQNTGDVCRIDVPIADGGGVGTDTGYFCDTEGGSSGSPVLARSTHRVVALHHTGDCTDGNQGVLMEQIWPLIDGFIPGEDELQVTSYGGGMWFEGSDPTNTPVSGDFDNNGFDDIAYRGKCGSGTECWRVHLNSGTGFTTTSFGGGMWFEGSDPTNTPVSGDFDNNGFDDIAYRGKCGSGTECWRVHLSNGSSFTTTSFGGGMWFEGSDATNAPVSGDFDNNGFDDIAYRGRCGGGTECWRAHLSNGSSFTVAGFGGSMWFEGSDYTNTPVSGDFDNNGFDDIAYRGRCGGGTECWRAHLSNGAGFTVAGFGANMWFQGSNAINAPFSADFDGNGIDDLGYFGYCGAGQLCWRMHLSNGSSFTADNYGGNMWFEGSDSTNRPVGGTFNAGTLQDVGYYGKCGGGGGAPCWRMHLH